MERRRLGNSDLQLSRLGLGAWAMGGGGWKFAWGPQDDGESIAAIRAALEAGWNWIDTAPVYGFGHSEEIVARALEGYSPRPFIFTKCGRTWREGGEIVPCLKRDSIVRECEASLRRLKVETIDLYQIHWPDPEPEVEEASETLVRLQQAGKIRWIGVSNFDVAQMQRIRVRAPITSLQPPYSLVAREVEDRILPFCRRNDIGVIVYSPMHSGLLSGAMTADRINAMPPDDHRRLRPHFREPALSRNLRLVEVLRDIGIRHGCTPGEVAIAWTLRHRAVTCAIVGLRSPRQLKGVSRAAGIQLARSDVEEITSFLRENPLSSQGS